MQQLILLDVDGTLLESYDIDGECYIRAVRKVFGHWSFHKNWDAYQHVTDQGILNELCMSYLGRLPLGEEVSEVKKHFLEYLEEEKQRIQAVDGAVAFFDWVKRQETFQYAIVTGGWKESAVLKLDAAGLRLRSCPVFSSNDAYDRVEIMKLAIVHFQSCFNTAIRLVYYVGDGVWDFHASQQLGIEFLLRKRSGVDVQWFIERDMHPSTMFNDFKSILPFFARKIS